VSDRSGAEGRSHPPIGTPPLLWLSGDAYVGVRSALDWAPLEWGNGMDFIVDDQEAVMSFIGSRKAAGQRLSISGSLPPDRTVLAVAEGRVVALAHCVVFPEIHAADASLLAEPGYGAYAVKALLHLKGMGLASHWQSTLRAPTPATMAISRRYFDSTLDQATWEISSKLLATRGPQNPLHPAALVASTSFLKCHGLPLLSKWTDAERSQLLAISVDPSRGALTSPAGFDLHATEIMTLAFELLDVPAEVRQHVTRIMLLCSAAAHGHEVAPLMGEQVRTEALGAFYSLNAPYRSTDPSAGLFGFRVLDAALFQEALRGVTQKAAPPARSWLGSSGLNKRRVRGHAVRRLVRLGGREGSMTRHRV
jgi:hypothetical protein